MMWNCNVYTEYDTCTGELTSCTIDTCITDYCIFDYCESAYSWFGLDEDFDWTTNGVPVEPPVCTDYNETSYCPTAVHQTNMKSCEVTQFWNDCYMFW